jgi:hypothetical protein
VQQSTTPQEVINALKATGATDEDVLYAAKTLYGAPFRFQRGAGIASLLLGTLISLTGIGALLGLPTALFGIWLWRKGLRNLAVVEAAFAGYIVERCSTGVASSPPARDSA